MDKHLSRTPKPLPTPRKPSSRPNIAHPTTPATKNTPRANAPAIRPSSALNLQKTTPAKHTPAQRTPVQHNPAQHAKVLTPAPKRETANQPINVTQSGTLVPTDTDRALKRRTQVLQQKAIRELDRNGIGPNSNQFKGGTISQGAMAPYVIA